MIILAVSWSQGFPDSSVGKESACNAGDPGLIPGLGRSLGEGIGYQLIFLGLPCSSDGKESACNAGDLGSIPGLERCPGEGNGNTLQYSYLENHMDRESQWATVRGFSESDTRKQLTLTYNFRYISKRFSC